MRIIPIAEDLNQDERGHLILARPGRLLLRLNAHLAWPENPSARVQFLAAMAAKRFSHLFADQVQQIEGDGAFGIFEPGRQVPASGLPCPSDIVDFLTHQFIVHGGGFGPVADAALKGPPLWSSFAKGQKNAALAGWRLLLTATMQVHHRTRVELRGGPSLGKATDLLAYRREKAGQAKTAVSIQTAWKSHRHIAHLAAAWELERVADEDVLETVERLESRDHAELARLERLLRLAHAFQNFGFDFVAARSLERCLDRDHAWRLPISLQQTDLQSALQPLPDYELEYLLVHRWADHPSSPIDQSSA